MPRLIDFIRAAVERLHVDLDIEVSGVGDNRAVLHPLAVLERNDVFAARDGHENVTDGGGIHHRHDLVAVHNGLERPDGVNFCHDDFRAEALGAQGHALAAPAIAAHDDVLTGHDEVRRAHDAVPHRLTRTVAVIEQVLAVGVIDHDHRETQRSGTVHDPQAVDAGRRLLTAADDLRNKIRELRVHQVHKIAAVVNDDVRPDGEHAAQVRLVFFVRAAVDRVHVHALRRQRCGNVVLRRQRVGPGDVHLRAAHLEHTAQVGRLGLQMHGERDLQAGKRLFARKIAADIAQNRHMCFHPADLPLTGWRQVQVLDRAHKVTSRCKNRFRRFILTLSSSVDNRFFRRKRPGGCISLRVAGDSYHYQPQYRQYPMPAASAPATKHSQISRPV